MKTVPASLSLIVIATLLVACMPSSKPPIIGELKLEFVHQRKADIHFKLKNQTSAQVSFRGIRDWWWESIFPQVPQFECAIGSSGQMHQGPFYLIDGPAWEEFVIESGEKVDIVVNSYYMKGSDGGPPDGRCRLVLHLEGDTVVKSDEFESMSLPNQSLVPTAHSLSRLGSRASGSAAAQRYRSVE